LLLDEPTNDLDIPTLEILEENLLEYRGALVLVTHDRFMLDRVSTVVIGLDGLGQAEAFADYSQWESWQRSHKAKGPTVTPTATQITSQRDAQPGSAKRKLSYNESREFATMEKSIAEAEQELAAQRDALQDSAVNSDQARLRDISLKMVDVQKAIDDLYARWAELERKNA